MGTVPPGKGEHPGPVHDHQDGVREQAVAIHHFAADQGLGHVGDNGLHLGQVETSSDDIEGIPVRNGVYP